ncbi:MAG: DNA-3-methyladenine glycosylase I [Oscillospiraceae bacterium]|nr:DNA-3-methyladenine glycosylase I [Oscillospiraceae bacterium]
MDRCAWCLESEEMTRYHDVEWGTPLKDDQKQFEFLMMEAMQCGLSWRLMIRKREIFRQCFAGFDPVAVAAFEDKDVARILTAEGMIRSERKIRAVIGNARRFLQIQREFGSFCAYLQSFAGASPILYEGHDEGAIPACNALSSRIAADLKKRGFQYLGSVTVYSHLQACGVVNDHLKGCFRYGELLARYPAVRLPPEGEPTR